MQKRVTDNINNQISKHVRRVSKTIQLHKTVTNENGNVKTIMSKITFTADFLLAH